MRRQALLQLISLLLVAIQCLSRLPSLLKSVIPHDRSKSHSIRQNFLCMLNAGIDVLERTMR